MSFYRNDRRNDPVRKVTHSRSASISQFWNAGADASRFLISGGSPELRAQLLARGIGHFFASHPSTPVILLHNDPRLAITVRHFLSAQDGSVRCTLFSSSRPNYLFLSSMSKEDILECLRSQIKLAHYRNEMELELCASSYMEILERYQIRISLDSLFELSQKTNEALTAMARQVRLPQTTLNIITSNPGASAGFREILRMLRKSAATLSRRDNRGQSVTGLLRHYDPRQFIALEVGSAATFSLRLTCLADELRLLQVRFPRMMLALSDVLLRRDDKLLELVESFSDSRQPLGLSAQALESMILHQPSYESIRGLIQKKILLHYSDAALAERMCTVFGPYEHTSEVTVTAPHGPLTLFKKRAPGFSKAMQPRVKASELLEMNAGSAVLYGHQGDQIVFAQSLSL